MIHPEPRECERVKGDEDDIPSLLAQLAFRAFVDSTTKQIPVAMLVGICCMLASKNYAKQLKFIERKSVITLPTVVDSGSP